MHKEEDKILIEEYHKRKQFFEDITYRTNEIMRIDGKLTTLYNYFNEEIEFENSSLKVLEGLVKHYEITFEIPEQGIFSTKFDDENENYPILYKEQPGLILDYNNIVGSFHRIEIINPLRTLNIDGNELLFNFKDKRIELETRLNAKRIWLEQEEIDAIKLSKKNPEISSMYTYIEIDPNYLTKLRKSNNNYNNAIKNYIKSRFNKNQIKKFQSFYPFKGNYNRANINIGNEEISLKDFLNDFMDETKIDIQYHNTATFERKDSENSFTEKASIKDCVTTVMDSVRDKIIGFVYYTEVSNPFPKQLSSINFANNPQEETVSTQAKIYMNNITKEEPTKNRYFWYAKLAKEYIATITIPRKRKK